MSLNTALSGGKALRVGVTLGMTAAALVGFASTSQAATTPTTTQPALTANPTSGTDAGGNYVTLTAGSAKFVKVNVTATPSNYTVYPVVVFEQGTGTTATCTATEPTASSAPATAIVNPPIAGTTNGANSTNGYVTVISPTKLSFQVPATLQSVITTSNLSQQYAICVYNKQTNLIGKSLYTIASAPTITGISPDAGPVTGGQTVTVSGDNFFAGLTANINGTPLTNITLIDQDTFTAVTGPQAASTAAVPLTVTSAGGSLTQTGEYTYDSALSVTPNTAVTGTTATLDVTGSGFSSIGAGTSAGGPQAGDWAWETQTTSTTPDDGSAMDSVGYHLYLVKGGVYSAVNNSGAKTNGEVNECTDPIVISDSELTCTLNLADSDASGVLTNGAATGNGLYYLAELSTGAIGATVATNAITSSSEFTVSPF